jgi:hypothetical protein
VPALPEIVVAGTSAFCQSPNAFFNLRHQLLQGDVANNREDCVIGPVVSRMEIHEVFLRQFFELNSAGGCDQGSRMIAVDRAIELLPEREIADSISGTEAEPTIWVLYFSTSILGENGIANYIGKKIKNLVNVFNQTRRGDRAFVVFENP